MFALRSVCVTIPESTTATTMPVPLLVFQAVGMLMPTALLARSYCSPKRASLGTTKAFTTISGSTYSTFGSAAIWRISASASTRVSAASLLTTSAPSDMRRRCFRPSFLPLALAGRTVRAAAALSELVIEALLVVGALPFLYLTMKRWYWPSLLRLPM
ncbi:hypothetical protein ASD69_18545 [Lysobacter sp. Root604]|nr:hypothetical protein ASD69_18545 [Lysobacter sp. Root604]